jgi:hypothetical protein
MVSCFHSLLAKNIGGWRYMAKKTKGKVKMISLEGNQLGKVTNEQVLAEFIKRFMKPFDDIIDELESKKESIEELKSEIEDLAS